MNNPRCVIYKRISKQESAEEGLSLEIQEDRCLAYIKQIGGTSIEVYSDPAYKRSDTKRPAFLRMKMNVAKDKFDTIVILKLDRLALPPADALKFFDYAEEHGVTVLSVSEPQLSGDGVGKLLRGILVQFSAFEVERIGERIRDMMEQKKKKGEFTGGNKVPLGLKYNRQTKKLEIDPEKKDIVREIYALTFEGKSRHKIAEILRDKGITTRDNGLFYYQAVSRILGSSFYVDAGLISKEDYNKAQKYLVERGWKRANHPALLHRLLYCECGAKAFPRTHKAYKGKGARLYYVCSRYNQFGKKVCTGSRKQLNISKGDGAVGTAIANWLSSDREQVVKEYEAFVDSMDKKEGIKELQEQLRQIEVTEHRLLAYAEAGAITSDQLRKRNLVNIEKMQRLQDQLKIAEENMMPPANEFESILDDYEDFNTLDFDERKNLVNLVTKRCVMHRDNIEIEYLFRDKEFFPIHPWR